MFHICVGPLAAVLVCAVHIFDLQLNLCTCGSCHRYAKCSLPLKKVPKYKAAVNHGVSDKLAVGLIHTSQSNNFVIVVISTL